MSLGSKIEWTEATWNPVRGCSKISPGCKHCYAETFAERFRNVQGHPYEQGFDLRLVPGKLIEPFLWPSPKAVFVNSMSDLFQDRVPDDYIATAIDIMMRANWHTYQILTKRAQRLEQHVSERLRDAGAPENIWWGVSVEDRKHGLPRIAHLQRTPASVRFLSVEPLLEDLGTVDLTGIHWVIVGGESGHGAREMRREWVESLHEQCTRSGVAFFFKQWGGVQKKENGRMLNGQIYDEMPPLSTAPMPSRAARLGLASEFNEVANAWRTSPLAQVQMRSSVSAA